MTDIALETDLELAKEMGLDEKTLDELKQQLEDMKLSGDAPEWFTWMGWQTVRKDYLWRANGEKTVKQAHQRISKAAASYLPQGVQSEYEEKFFNLLWKGHLIPSSPVFSNLGTTRGMAVSCSGTYVSDDLGEIYSVLRENAMLTKFGFGTSANFTPVRERGRPIKGTGGVTSGIMSWLPGYKEMVNNVNQGTRRGALAAYLDIMHGDFYEVMEWFKHNHDKFNLGITYGADYKALLRKGDPEALKRRQKVLEYRREFGGPYYVDLDTINKHQPQKLIDLGLLVSMSNLCTEITLPSSRDYSFSCVLSSMNGLKRDEWFGTDAVFLAIVFLDCVAQDLIERGTGVDGLEKVVAFTKKARALGLGLLGYHSYLQDNLIAFESLEAGYFNNTLFKYMKTEAVKASQWLAQQFGECEWTEGTGLRNTHLLAIAPNTTSSHLAGSTSQGIEPWVGNYFMQRTSKGDFLRINPAFIKLLKSKGHYTKDVLETVRDKQGSVQHLAFLSDHEKAVFRTAYEIDQMVILRQAEQRQKFVCQGQSLNLFFPKTGDDWTQEQIHDLNQYIDDCHSYAEDSDWIKALYYVRSQSGLSADTGRSACLACEG